MNYWLQQGGYHTAARGKTYHSSQQGEENDVKIYTDEWDDYPKVHAGDVVKEYTDRMGFTEDIELSRKVRDDDDPDWHTVDFCAEKLNEDPQKRDNKPLFLACGFVKVSYSFATSVYLSCILPCRSSISHFAIYFHSFAAQPHLPWVVPQKYYDRFPADEVKLPPYSTTNDWKEWRDRVEEDLEDVPEYAIDKIARPDKEFEEVVELGKWETSIQSYLAAIAYLDMNIGRLVDAFENSPERDNTIIMLWSDHGYHLGEKGHHKKQTLWEEASDVPFIWVVPGMTKPGSICNKPVDLQSIYPTLFKLVGLDVPDHVDGDDIRPLLEDADADWDGVATVTVRYKNHAIVDERYRYIRYVDGSEELYDHDIDPNEFTNLRKDPNYADVKARLRARLPKVDMPTWRPEDDISMNLNVQITCNDKTTTVKRCPGAGNPYFVARDPNNDCKFLDCPEYDAEPTASPSAKPTGIEIDTDDYPTFSPTESPGKDPTASTTLDLLFGMGDPTASPVKDPTASNATLDVVFGTPTAVCAAAAERSQECGSTNLGRPEFCCDGYVCVGKGSNKCILEKVPEQVEEEPPTASPTAAPFTVIDTGVAELLDFGVSIDIPGAPPEESDRRQLERSDVALYLNENLEAILSGSMLDELVRVIDSSGFPFAKPSSVSLTRKNKKVTEVGDGERYQVTYGGIVTFVQTEAQQFLPTKADVQGMQAEVMPRVGDRVVDDLMEEMADARISSVVADVIMTSDAMGAPDQPRTNEESNSNTLYIAIGCAVGGVVLLALAAFLIVRSKKTSTKKATDDTSYNYPDEEEDTDNNSDDKSPVKNTGASTLAEEALKEEDGAQEQASPIPSSPKAASDDSGSPRRGKTSVEKSDEDEKSGAEKGDVDESFVSSIMSFFE